MYYVYLLKSVGCNEFYIGSTNDLKARFREHNKGKVFSTKKYKPWKLVYYEAYLTEQLARMREKKLKYHGNAKRELKRRAGFVVKNGAGFTLVELLVTITIIGILATLSLFALQNARVQGRDAQRKSNLESIRSAIELRRADCNTYPATMPAVGAVWDGQGCNTNVYIQSRPGDPQNPTRSYLYTPGAGNLTYSVCAALEETPATACTGLPGCGGACGVACNYCVISP